MLFFPDPWIELEPGTLISLEVVFDASDQHCTLSGVVRNVEQRSPRGAWLELAAPGALPSLRLAETAPRRRHPRVTTSIFALLERSAESGQPVRIVDVSLSGARVIDAPALEPGELVLLRPLNPDSALRSCVLWGRYGETGLEFQRTEAATRTAASALLSRAVHGRERIPDVRHPVACACLEGGRLLEPTRPRNA